MTNKPFFCVYLSYRNTQSLPEKFGGGIFVDYQLFTMKHTKKLYLVPCLHEIMLHVERGFDASLEDPFTDPDHGWATDCYYYGYDDKIIL